jgi:hypothetical protein
MAPKHHRLLVQLLVYPVLLHRPLATHLHVRCL